MNRPDQNTHYNNDMETPNLLPPLAQEPMNLANFPSNIFSIIIRYMKWVSSFRWYIIVLIVTIVLFIIFQLEQSIESRRRKKDAQKEGMQSEETQPKGILKNMDDKLDISKKHVSFKSENELREYNTIEPLKQVSTVNETIANIYNLWILPGLYVFSRKMGL